MNIDGFSLSGYVLWLCCMLFLYMCLTPWNTIIASCCQCCLDWPTHAPSCLLSLVLISPGIIFLLPEEHPLVPLGWVFFGQLYFCLHCTFILEACFHCLWNSGLVVSLFQHTEDINPLSSVFRVVGKRLLWRWRIWRSRAFFPLAALKVFFVFGFLQFHYNLCRCGFLFI